VCSKVGRFIEGLYAFVDILTKICVNCVINLHAALLFMCLFLWVYPMCGYNYLYIYGHCLYIMHVYVYCYFSLNPCIYIIYLSFYIIYIKLRKSFVCICFNFMQFKKIMWHSSVGHWVCYSMLRRE
jgi:hypothetical protein